MKKFNFISNSDIESMQFGKKFSKTIQQGSIFGLIGGLATGKTTFVKGLMEGLGYKYTVSSPTFTLINNYQGKFDVMHVDFYREPNKKRWIDLGFNELLYNSDYVFIEWADLIPSILPKETIYLKFEHFQSGKRKISLL